MDAGADASVDAGMDEGGDEDAAPTKDADADSGADSGADAGLDASGHAAHADSCGTFQAVTSDLDTLTRDERAWLERDEQRWRRAHEIAARHPGMDASGVYRVLRNLEKTPSERLGAALQHGRLFRTHAR